MSTGAVRLCLLAVWWSAAGASPPAPCPPRSSMYQRDGRDYYCIADTDDCRLKYVKNQFIRDSKSLGSYLLQAEETCSLCLPSCCSQKPISSGVCSEVKLNNSLEFFGFNETEQGWERSTAEYYTFVVPAKYHYSLRYDIPHGHCVVNLKNYGVRVSSLACVLSTVQVPACTEGQQHDGVMCVTKASIG